MPSDKQKMLCERCRSSEIFFKPKINHPLHIVLSVLTCGLWLISYGAIAMGHQYQPWICSGCAHAQFTDRQKKKRFLQKIFQRFSV